jgi:hypothetical protein
MYTSIDVTRVCATCFEQGGGIGGRVLSCAHPRPRVSLFTPALVCVHPHVFVPMRVAQYILAGGPVNVATGAVAAANLTCFDTEREGGG